MKPPPGAVLDAFGMTGAAMLLPGGQGETWRVGEVVLKPAHFVPEAEWRASVLSGLVDAAAFRVAQPVRALDGGWVVDGWEASSSLAGATDARRPDDVLEAGAAFHAAVADLPRPDFLEVRDDPWTYGDRVAWEELPLDGSHELLGMLIDARQPVESAAQVVHGDLLGNVMFADGLPPAIIDWPVYWRPPAWAAAVAIVDALCWYGAQPALAARWAHLPEWGQMLVRALIYRIATDLAARGSADWTSYRPAVETALSYTR
ncbi:MULTISPECIES: TIGR02569 family protein [unclassified Kribbella]|uniref:TIGR02569 family protein n=1 Tax=unclassified Kribbella TaxID=2644121 RepID=UPI0033EC1CD3